MARRNTHRSRYTLEEVVSIIEDDDEIISATVSIFPPDDGDVSAEDSGDENDDQNGNIDNLSRRQLLAEAEADIQTVNLEIGHIGIEENHDAIIEDGRRKRKWSQTSLSSKVLSIFPAETTPTISSLVDVFELIFTPDFLRWMCDMFELYATQRYNDYEFKISIHELKAWFAIFLSGYVSVPRWRMYWEVNSESSNDMVANAMS